MVKIVIPLAGSSELFSNIGYHYPKPLIEIKSKPMIELVISNPSMIKEDHQFIFIIKEEDADKYHIDNTLKLLSPGCEVVKLKKSTKGSLCSILMAIDKIEKDDSLIVLNGDQIIDIDFNDVLHYWKKQKFDCGLVTFRSVHPRWSYARIEDETVIQTAEKNPISQHAIAGYYYFENASVFFEAAFQCIKNDVHLDGFFYVSPVVNQLILINKRVGVYNIESDKYHSLYSPQMLTEFERQVKPYLI
jgi:NDP-sugar pyrophosphorylase family protein